MNNYGEPWDWHLGFILDNVGNIPLDNIGEEFGKRIVACVNACAGLSDEELAALGTGGVKGLVKFIDDHRRITGE